MTNAVHSEVFSRTLVYIPIVHTEADMGALYEPLKRTALRRLGQASLRRKKEFVDKIWTKIEEVIDGLALTYTKVRLYQDGLPVCGREVEIVRDLARVGSRNHRLLLHLMEKGASIMGTESAELLVQEYQLVKQMLTPGHASRSGKAGDQQKALSDSLLRRRDQFIADGINGTLSAGETGILFLGLLHALENRLDEDIHVIYPLKDFSNF
jgi:hypothetical protein